MSVTILSPDPSVVSFNNGTPSATYSPVATATGIVLPINYAEFDGTSTLTAFTLSAIGFTRVIQVEDISNNQAFSEIWWMPAASIPGGSGLTLAATTAGAWKDFDLALMSLAGSATATPTVTNSDHNGTGATLTAAVSCSIGDLIVACACNDRAGTAFGAWGNSFTSVQEGASAGSLYRSAIGYKIAVSTSETATITQSSGTAHSATLAVAVIPQPAAAAGAAIAWVVA